MKGADGNQPWQEEFSAEISGLAAPEPVQHQLAAEGELKYWVKFDAPQYDSDGDGPYRQAQI
ncbi:MAG: hypothetical protein LBV34_27900, partial [Nocardiopsaceae bacterium]|nr:hypothetical protein [Nocardiopsaceae bacterium]